MKCIKFYKNIRKDIGLAGSVARINNDVAEKLVLDGHAFYVQKSEWKRISRNPVDYSGSWKRGAAL